MKFKALDYWKFNGWDDFSFLSQYDIWARSWDHDGFIFPQSVLKEIETYPSSIELTEAHVQSAVLPENIRIRPDTPNCVRVLHLRLEELKNGEVVYSSFIPKQLYVGFGVYKGNMYRYYWSPEFDGETGTSVMHSKAELLLALGYKPIELVVALGKFIVIPLPNVFTEEKLLFYLGIGL